MTRRTPMTLLAIVTALSLAACGATSGNDLTSPASGETTADASTPVPSSTAASAASFPVTVDSCGRDYTYTKAPHRVVLGFPGTLATLDALGVGDSVYGYALGSYAPLPTNYPSRIVEVSPDYAPAREPVIAAKPDLFLGNDEGQVTSKDGVSYDDLASVEANVYILGGYCTDAPAGRSLDGIYTDITNLGAIFGVPDRAAQLTAQIRDRVAAAKAKVAGTPQRVAFVQAYDGKLYAISGYPASSIISALGMVNEFDDVKGNFAEISTEEALTRKPDVVFVVGTGTDSVTDVTAILAGTPAVEAGRVFGVEDAQNQAGGVSIIDQLEYVADSIANG